MSLLVIGLVVCGCRTHAAAPSQPATTPVPLETRVTEAPVAQEAEPPPRPQTTTVASPLVGPVAPLPEGVVLSAALDFDGRPGLEPIVLHGNGTLEIGALRGTIEIPDTHEFWMPAQGTLHVVQLDTRRDIRALWIAVPSAGEEDPPNRNLFVIAQGDSLRLVFDEIGGELRFPGDGTIRRTALDWTVCHSASDAAKRVPRVEVTWRLTARGTMAPGRSVRSRSTTLCEERAG